MNIFIIYTILFYFFLLTGVIFLSSFLVESSCGILVIVVWSKRMTVDIVRMNWLVSVIS